MKNLSGDCNWGKETGITKEKEEEVVDNRVILSYLNNEISYFLESDGIPLVFSDSEKAENYITKNELEGYEIDNFKDFDFTDIEIIEL